jgi:hypothetical protein
MPHVMHNMHTQLVYQLLLTCSFAHDRACASLMISLIIEQPGITTGPAVAVKALHVCEPCMSLSLAPPYEPFVGS